MNLIKTLTPKNLFFVFTFHLLNSSFPSAEEQKGIFLHDWMSVVDAAWTKWPKTNMKTLNSCMSSLYFLLSAGSEIF